MSKIYYRVNTGIPWACSAAYLESLYPDFVWWKTGREILSRDPTIEERRGELIICVNTSDRDYCTADPGQFHPIIDLLPVTYLLEKI